MKKYILTMILSLLGLTAMAQSLTVKGVVTSKTDGEPLIGATVRVQGTSQGTATDIDGNYTLTNVPSNATLIFNYVGFQELTIPVKGQTTINAEMSETSNSLDELVVVGYGVAKKSDLTSSISTIKGSELNEMVSGNAMDAIQGRVPGVQVVSGGGPGANPSVMIRGVTSVNGTAPLYVVDGVPLNTDNINFLNNNDIESMRCSKTPQLPLFTVHVHQTAVSSTTQRKVKPVQLTLTSPHPLAGNTSRSPASRGPTSMRKYSMPAMRTTAAWLPGTLPTSTTARWTAPTGGNSW